MNGPQAEVPTAAAQEQHAAPALVTTGEPAGPAEEPVVGAAPAVDVDTPVQQQQQPLQQPELDRNGQELFRLFVGALPQDYFEEELRPLFSKYGTLKGVSVLREPDGTSKSCGFVLYDNRESAERAIAVLDRALTLPGQGQPIEVRFARKPALVQPGAGPQDNRQIFFSGGPPGVARKDVVQLFSYYGKVEHVHLFMDFRTKQSKGCGFVTFSTRKEAEDAMTALDQSYTMPGARMVLTVRWHDPDLQERKRRAAEGLAEDQRQLFVAKVLKSSPEEDVQQLFSHYGQVDKVTMFRPAPDAVYHKGCGVVTMARREDAEAALRALDEAYVWPGMTEPLVVKWMDSDLNKRRRFEPSMPGIVSLEPPPPGCDPDAVKLYAGNIPLSYSVDNIRQVFKQYGRVIQILVARDKETHQPKGSAYVWFQRRRESELALKRLNGSTTAMPDPAAPHAKPLMVTLAQHSVAPVRKLGGPGGAPLGPIGYMAGGQGGGQGGFGGGQGGFGGGQGMAQPLQLPHSAPQYVPQQSFPAQQQQHGGGYGGMAGPQQGFGMAGQQQYPSQQAQQGMGGYGVGASGAGEDAYYDQSYGYGSNASQDPNAYYDGSAGYGTVAAAGHQAAGYGMPPGGPMKQQPQQQQQLPPQQAQQGYGSHGGGYASPAAQGPGVYGGPAGQAGQYNAVPGQSGAVQNQGQYGAVQGQGQYGAGGATTSIGGGYGVPSYNPQGGYYPGTAASARPSSAGGGPYGGPSGAYGGSGSGYQAGPGYGAPPAAQHVGGMQEGPGMGPQQQYGGYAGHQPATVGQYGYGQ